MATKTNKLKAYFWKFDEDADCGYAIVAHSAKEAKKMGFAEWGAEVGHEEDDFISQRVKQNKEADIKGLTEPQIITDLIDGLKRGMYAYVEADEPCSKCNAIISVVNEYDIVGDKLICEECRGKMELLKTPSPEN